MTRVLMCEKSCSRSAKASTEEGEENWFKARKGETILSSLKGRNSFFNTLLLNQALRSKRLRNDCPVRLWEVQFGMGGPEGPLPAGGGMGAGLAVSVSVNTVPVDFAPFEHQEASEGESQTNGCCP